MWLKTLRSSGLLKSTSYQKLVRLASFWSSKKPPTHDVVKPGRVSPELTIPDHIERPSYSTDKFTRIEVKNETQIQGMRKACRLARKILQAAASHAKVGITTDEIDKIVHGLCIENDAYPSPLLYQGFPKSVCTSVNNIAIHGIPDNRPLKDGDILNIDVTVFYQGFHGDCSETYPIGQVDEAGYELINITRRCRDEAIGVCKPGVRFTEIGNKISHLLEGTRFNVLSSICGHGIGEFFHGPPDVIHCAAVNASTEVMKPGMTFTIEPCITEGVDKYRILEDGWTVVTTDDCRTAQFEHTVLITDTGVEILTL